MKHETDKVRVSIVFCFVRERIAVKKEIHQLLVTESRGNTQGKLPHAREVRREMERSTDGSGQWTTRWGREYEER